MSTPKFDYYDFEEDESTDAIKDKYVLTIADEDGEEYATIIHRTCNGRYPLDGELANEKRARAQMIVDALNAHIGKVLI